MSKLVAVVAASLILAGCNATANARSTSSHKSSTMVATWYQHGTRTANGERFKPDGMTAAHRTIPFNTRIRLTHRDKSVIVRINDRGPFIKGRHIDLSRGAARALGCGGVCTLHAEILGQ